MAPAGCTLSGAGLEEQAARLARLALSAVSVSRTASGLRVRFARDVDRELVREVVATERACCSFLRLDYEAAAGVLRLRSDAKRGAEVLDRLADVFGGR